MVSVILIHSFLISCHTSKKAVEEEIIISSPTSKSSNSQEYNPSAIPSLKYDVEKDNPYSILKEWNYGVAANDTDALLPIGIVELKDYFIFISSTKHMFIAPIAQKGNITNDSIALCLPDCYLLQPVSPYLLGCEENKQFNLPLLDRSLREERYMVLQKRETRNRYIDQVVAYYHKPKAYFLYKMRARVYNFNYYFVHDSNFLHESAQRRWQSAIIKEKGDDDFLTVVCPIWK